MKIKFILALLVTVTISLSAYSQEEDNDRFFKKENFFTGGTLNATFGNQITALGISPYIGYSFNKYIDIAINTGINYQSEREASGPGSFAKFRSTSYGPGAFVRVFPVKFLFAQAQFEYNFFRSKYLPTGYNSGGYIQYKSDVRSLLIGAGISNGKDFPYQKSYYYFSVLWDVADGFGKSIESYSNSNITNTFIPRSPYRDIFNRSFPIFRAGYNIALFQGKK
jgi:hypothetical protein